MPRLDRGKAYEAATGLVGDNEPFFYQDGRMFNKEGTEVFADGTTEDGLGSDLQIEDPMAGDDTLKHKAKTKRKHKPEVEDVDLVGNEDPNFFAEEEYLAVTEDDKADLI